MYNIHPTIIDQNSNFYNESAKLACIFNDISVKQESIITQSAPEQVIWVWEIASEGVQRDFGRLNHTPPPEAHELRGAQLSIFINCARVFSFIQIIYENTPSNEPDELSIMLASGSWRVLPYLDAVFKPIKDGINNWLRNIAQVSGNKLGEYFENSNYDSKGGTKSGEGGQITNADFKKIYNAIFGSAFIKIIEILLIVLDAITFIISPFLFLISGLINKIADFIGPIIQNAFAPNSGSGENKEIESGATSGNVNFLIRKFEEENSAFIGWFSFFISFLSLALSFIANKMGSGSVARALFWSFLSLIISAGSIAVSSVQVYNTPGAFDDADFTLIVGILLACISCLLGFVGLYSTLTGTGNAIFKVASVILNSVAIFLSFASFLCAFGQAMNFPFEPTPGEEE